MSNEEEQQPYIGDYEYTAFEADVCGSSSVISTETSKRKTQLKFQDLLQLATTKNHKSKKQLLEHLEEQDDIEIQEPVFSVPKAIKTEFDIEMNPVETEEHEDSPNNVEEIIDWPQQDFQELVKRIEMAIPEKDGLAYGTRVEKLNWDEIAFSSYSGEKCKKAWLFVQRRMRRFRYLMEILQDAKELLGTSWPNFLQNRNKRHPDMPKRPLSTYLIYYMNKKDKVLLENPGIDLPEMSKKIGIMFKNLSSTRKDKYIQLALKERRKYQIKLEEFYQSHPEVPRNTAGGLSKAADVGPRKPQTPFGLYYENKLKLVKPEDEDRSSFREQCKEQWKKLSDKKKLIWIDLALESESNYQEELKTYILQNPNFIPAPCKPVLSKEEKLLKDRLAGKPKKPPQSAYGLFSQMMMQSEDIKKIDVKYRIKSIAEQWKSCTEDEKKRFKEHADYLMEKYKIEFANYIESLPEDKRKQEIENNSVKRKKSHECANHINNHKKKKPKVATTTSVEENNIVPTEPENQEKTQHKVLKQNKKKNNQEENNDQEAVQKNDFLKILQAEPPTPPMSGLDLFSTRYHGRAPVEIAWKKLNKQDKKEYQIEVEIIKEAYIKDYENFLKGLTKEQLTAYSQLKKKARTEQVSGDSSSNAGD